MIQVYPYYSDEKIEMIDVANKLVLENIKPTYKRVTEGLKKKTRLESLKEYAPYFVGWCEENDHKLLEHAMCIVDDTKDKHE